MRCFVLFVAAAALPASASTVTFFSSRSAWEAATTDRVLLATFSEPLWPINQVLTGSWTLNGVTYRGLAGKPAFNIFVITPSPLTGPALTANGDENIDITLANAARGFAFDVAVNTFGPVFIRVYDAADREMGMVEIAQNTIGFFGVTSVGGISRVNFRS